jgi:hypothetical protein
MAETCDKCGQELPEPKTAWLTTSEVIAQYGFDPREFGAENGGQKILSKLTGGMLRVWLKDSVEAHPLAKQRMAEKPAVVMPENTTTCQGCRKDSDAAKKCEDGTVLCGTHYDDYLRERRAKKVTGADFARGLREGPYRKCWEVSP